MAHPEVNRTEKVNFQMTEHPFTVREAYFKE